MYNYICVGLRNFVVHTEEDGHDKHNYMTVMCMHACSRSRPRTLQFEFLNAYTPTGKKCLACAKKSWKSRGGKMATLYILN